MDITKPAHHEVEKLDLPAACPPPEHHDAENGNPHLDWRVWPVSAGFFLAWCSWLCTFSLPSSVLSYINADIGPHPNYTWVVIAIAIGIATVWPITGSLSDLLGRRYFFLIGLTGSLVGSIIACTAKSIPILIFASTIIGIATAMNQMILAGISEIYPRKYRGYAQGAVNFVSTPFAGLGPYVAHLIIARLNWRWIYYIAIIIDVVAFALLALFYHPIKPNRELSRWQLAKKIDFIGLILYALGLAVFLVGVGWAGGQYSWNSAAVLAPMIGGGALVVACGFWEVYGTQNPLFPPFLFKDMKGFTNIIIICFVASMPLLAGLTFWPIQMGNVYTRDVLKIGLYCLPWTLGTVAGGTGTATIKYWKPTNLYLVGWCALLTIFAGLLSTLGPGDLTKALVYAFFYGTTVGFCEISLIVIIQLSTHHENLGVVTGILSAARGVAGGLGISIYGSILSTRIAADLPTRMASTVFPMGLPESSFPLLLGNVFSQNFTAIAEIPGVTPDMLLAIDSSARNSWAYAFKPLYWLGASLGVVAVILAYFTYDISKRMNNTLDVDLKTHEPSHLDAVLHHKHHHEANSV